MNMEWKIEDDCFKARTDKGNYQISDWGSGKARLEMPGNVVSFVLWDEAKGIAQAHYEASK
jgi:hypothetical protein